MNPYDLQSDPQFRKFFKHLLKPEEIMTSEQQLHDAEFDKLTERSEVRAEAIQARVEGLWQQKGEVCRVIAETLDEINIVDCEGFDVAGDIEQIITRAFTCEAEADYE